MLMVTERHIISSYCFIQALIDGKIDVPHLLERLFASPVIPVIKIYVTYPSLSFYGFNP